MLSIRFDLGVQVISGGAFHGEGVGIIGMLSIDLVFGVTGRTVSPCSVVMVRLMRWPASSNSSVKVKIVLLNLPASFLIPGNKLVKGFGGIIMQHTANVDDIALVTGYTDRVIAQFCFPLGEIGVLTGVMDVAAEHVAIRRIGVVIKHDGVVAENKFVFSGCEFIITLDGRKVVHHFRRDFIVVTLDKVDVAVELLKDHRSFGRVPEHIAKDINVITRSDNTVPALDKLRVHGGQIQEGAAVKTDNVAMRKMKVSSKEIHSTITSDVVR